MNVDASARRASIDVAGMVPPPPPPPGPGVQPPFVAPPTDGVRRRRWVGIGIAGALVVVLCLGGVVGIAALGIFGEQMVVDRSRTAVQDYLSALQAGDYAKAYGLLCPAEHRRRSIRQFETDQNLHRPIASFTVAQPQVQGDTIEVPVDVEYVDGFTGALSFPVEQNSSTGEFEVCGDGS